MEAECKRHGQLRCIWLRFLMLFLLLKSISEGSFLSKFSPSDITDLLFSINQDPLIGHTSNNGNNVQETTDNFFINSLSKDIKEHSSITQGHLHHVPLDLNDTLHLYWTVDYHSELVHMEVHHRIPPFPFFWIAVGFSPNETLKGADLCIFWEDWKKQIHFQNAMVKENSRLKVFNSQECNNFAYKAQNGVLKFVFTRKFDTCTEEHYIIERGTTNIVWSWGKGPLYDLEGVLADGDNSGFVRVEILKPPIPEPNLDKTEQLLVAAKEVAVPAEETTYWCSVQKLPKIFSQKHHMVKFGPKIEKENKDIVHHMEVFHCELPKTAAVPLYQGPCHLASRPAETDNCKRVIAAWAMGAIDFSYPNEAGSPLGGEDFNPFVMLEVHYNNPNKIKGRIDNSGILLTYSSELRRYDAGIMELGLEYTAKMAIPPSQLSFTIAGFCTSECTALGIPHEGIFIFGSQLHTHLTGIKVWTKHYRGKSELPELNRDNHYSTHFQEIRRLPNVVEVLPGDDLVTFCEYVTLSRENVTVGGFSISDEMCVNYVHYYPKVDLEVCKSSIDSKTLVNYFDFMHRLELQPTSPDLDWGANYRSIFWTPLRSSFLHNLYAEAPLSMQCNKSSGQRFPGFWENKRIPRILHPLPTAENKCNINNEN